LASGSVEAEHEFAEHRAEPPDLLIEQVGALAGLGRYNDAIILAIKVRDYASTVGDWTRYVAVHRVAAKTYLMARHPVDA
jgi:hypothetical protein